MIPDWLLSLWPVLAFMAICYGMVLLANATEYWLRRHARRRARVMLAPEPDLTGCIQRAGLKNQDPRNKPAANKSIEEMDKAELIKAMDDIPGEPCGSTILCCKNPRHTEWHLLQRRFLSLR